MKIYKVGGCVRDTLLGLEPKDIDYVVVGATPEEMVSNGFQQVGAAFPVFLKNGEEYALARKEKKVGVGYNGFEVEFSPDVTLEEDLYRRDLTINAMALDEDGTVIDPYGGRQDLEAGVLRHVSDAFAEDPIRVLRIARFAARYAFDIDPDTMKLMRKVAPELDHVAPERIWAEFEKGLGEKNLYLMGEALLNCRATLDVDAVKPFLGFGMLQEHATVSTPLDIRFALGSCYFKPEDYERCKIPTAYARLAKAFNLHRFAAGGWMFWSIEERVKTFMELRAFSDPEMIHKVFQTTLYFSKGHICNFTERMEHDLKVATSIDAESIAKMCPSPKMIAPTIFHARCEAMETDPECHQWTGETTGAQYEYMRAHFVY